MKVPHSRRACTVQCLHSIKHSLYSTRTRTRTPRSTTPITLEPSTGAGLKPPYSGTLDTTRQAQQISTDGTVHTFTGTFRTSSRPRTRPAPALEPPATNQDHAASTLEPLCLEPRTSDHLQETLDQGPSTTHVRCCHLPRIPVPHVRHDAFHVFPLALEAIPSEYSRSYTHVWPDGAAGTCTSEAPLRYDYDLHRGYYPHSYTEDYCTTPPSLYK